MTHQPARFSTAARVLAGISSLWLLACTSAELAVPTSHPGHPQASSGRVASTEALTEAYALDTSTAPAAAPANDHAGHQHGAHVAPAATEQATQGASQPAAAAFTCPMHPEVERREAGKCPICRMNLVPKKDAK